MAQNWDYAELSKAAKAAGGPAVLGRAGRREKPGAGAVSQPGPGTAETVPLHAQGDGRHSWPAGGEDSNGTGGLPGSEPRLVPPQIGAGGMSPKE